MTEEWRIRNLLEQILDSHCAPEEACVEGPELLSEVRKRLAQLRRVEGQLDNLFPLSNSENAGTSHFSAKSQLPIIDGYDVQSILGYGGMGVVYTAKHLKLNRMVALKMLLAGPHATPQEVARFVRESQAVVGQQILQKGGDAAPFLKRVQQVHPEDFWVNITLAMSTFRKNPAESIRYFQAAIAMDRAPPMFMTASVPC